MRFSSLLLLNLFGLMQGLTYSQERQPDLDNLKTTAPKIFLDCSYCDIDYIRTEITFVNYVRDRTDADVHLLITTQPTGSGGVEYTLTYSGQRDFAGQDHVFKYASNKTDTRDEVRSGLVRKMKIGLLPYVGKTPIADSISVSLEGKMSPISMEDKWNYWVFSLSARGFFEGEQSQSSRSLSGSVSAARITPSLKFRSTLSGNSTSDRFSYENETINSSSQSRNLSMLLVKSISEHWSVGGWLSASSSTYSNTRLLITPTPAIEFDLFPYSESTRKQLRFLYRPGFSAYRYREETIYDKTSDQLWGESFSGALELKEKWGTISGSIEGFHYFHDFSKNHIRSNGEISIRIFKGLSFNLWGSFARVRDQLSLPKGGASLEEILLRRTQLATSYSYYGSIGFSYTFGSIYSNVVNPRFGF